MSFEMNIHLVTVALLTIIVLCSVYYIYKNIHKELRETEKFHGETYGVAS